MKLLIILLLFLTSGARAEELVQVPPLSNSKVIDQASVLSSSGKAAIESIIQSLETEKGSQIAVLVVNSTAPESIEQFSFRVAENWKIGRKKVDDGVVVVIAIQDRKSRIEVGYGLEGAIPDVTAKRILDDIVRPYFKNGDFDGGLKACVESLASLIRGEELPSPPETQFSSNVNEDGIFHVIIIGLIVSSFLKIFLSRAKSSFIASAIAVIIGLIFYIPVVAVIGGIMTLLLSAVSSAEGSGGYSSGSSSSGWRSSSSSSGGGGGSFGGGGASGSW